MQKVLLQAYTIVFYIILSTCFSCNDTSQSSNTDRSTTHKYETVKPANLKIRIMPGMSDCKYLDDYNKDKDLYFCDANSGATLSIFHLSIKRMVQVIQARSTYDNSQSAFQNCVAYYQKPLSSKFNPHKTTKQLLSTESISVPKFDNAAIITFDMNNNDPENRMFRSLALLESGETLTEVSLYCIYKDKDDYEEEFAFMLRSICGI